MLLLPILELTAFLLLLAAALLAARFLAPSPARRRKMLALLGASALLVACAAGLNLAQWIQTKQGIDLKLPSDLRTRAKIWLNERQGQTPDRSQVGRNMRLIADACLFYRTYQQEFPAQAKAILEPLCGLSTKPDHLLSLSEERRYYEAAQQAYSVIQELAR